MENNWYYKQLLFMQNKTGDKEIEQLIYRGIKLNRGNEEYVKDMYKLIMKKVKRVKGVRINYLGKGLIRDTSYKFNPWCYSEEEVNKCVVA